MKIWIITLMFIIPFIAKADMAAIEGLYKSKCASCHGAKGEGRPALAKMLKVSENLLSLSKDSTQKAKDDALLKILLDGKGKMPGYKGKITDEEATHMIHIMRSFKKK